MTMTAGLKTPWIIWVNEAGEYACADCAAAHAEEAKWHRIHEGLWSADPEGEDHSNEAHEVWPYAECDTPQACIGCEAWLDVTPTSEFRNYMIEHNFPAEVFELYGVPKCAHPSPADYGASQVRDGVLVHPCGDCGLIMAWTVTDIG